MPTSLPMVTTPAHTNSRLKTGNEKVSGFEKTADKEEEKEQKKPQAERKAMSRCQVPVEDKCSFSLLYEPVAQKVSTTNAGDPFYQCG